VLFSAATLFRLNEKSSNTKEFADSTWYGRGPGSSVGIATDYGLDCPGIEHDHCEKF
jgi:hypothetical protein